MIVDERMVTFINSLDEGHTEFLEQLEKEAREDAVPIVRREMQSFLKFLMAAARPKRILEVGTAVGFSALLMCEYNPEPCQIITIENYEKRIPIARDNFKKAGKEEQIELLEGDAAEILPTLTEPFDFIFMDIMMPVMDGLEAARQIRTLNRKDTKEIPIIAMTANAFQDDIRDCIDAGMNAHIAKPIDSKKIEDTLQFVLKQKMQLSL